MPAAGAQTARLPHAAGPGETVAMRGWSLQARTGAAAARQRYDRVKPSSLQPSWPWKSCRSTTRPFDVLVVDEWERQPLGRPWLTLAIDVASRFVTGFQISLDRPSSLTVALVLTQAVLPKEGFRLRILGQTA